MPSPGAGVTDCSAGLGDQAKALDGRRGMGLASEASADRTPCCQACLSSQAWEFSLSTGGPVEGPWEACFTLLGLCCL